MIMTLKQVSHGSNPAGGTTKLQVSTLKTFQATPLEGLRACNGNAPETWNWGLRIFRAGRRPEANASAPDRVE